MTVIHAEPLFLERRSDLAIRKLIACMTKAVELVEQEEARQRSQRDAYALIAEGLNRDARKQREDDVEHLRPCDCGPEVPFS